MPFFLHRDIWKGRPGNDAFLLTTEFVYTFWGGYRAHFTIGTLTQSLAPTEPQERPDVVQVRILTSDADLDWTGNIMGSDLVSSTIEGEGDDAILMRCDEDNDGKEGSANISINSVNSLNNFLLSKHFTDVIDKYIP